MSRRVAAEQVLWRLQEKQMGAAMAVMVSGRVASLLPSRLVSSPVGAQPVETAEMFKHVGTCDAKSSLRSEVSCKELCESEDAF